MVRKSSNSVLLLTVVLATVAAGFTTARKAAKAMRATAAEAPISHAYGAFWKVGTGFSTDLILRNHDQQHPANLTLTLYSHEGLETHSTQINMAAGSTSRVDLADILKATDNTPHWGGLAIDFTGSVTAQVFVEDAESHHSYALDVQGGYRYDTENALHVPWWLPSQGQGVLTAFNTSDQQIVVSPSLVNEHQEKAAAAFSLAPHESKKLNLADLLIQSGQPENAKVGSITLRYSGPSHALQPALFLSSPGDFALTPSIGARHQQRTNQETIWHFPEVALSMKDLPGSLRGQPATAYALLTNATDAPLTPELIASVGGLKSRTRIAGGKRRSSVHGSALKSNQRAQNIPLPVATLMPFETRLVNLTELFATGLIPTGISHVGLTAKHRGTAGDLGITVFSIEPTRQLVFRSSGVIQAPTALDASYWSTGKRMALPVVRNEAETPAQVRVTLFFQTSQGLNSYILPALNIAPRNSRRIGLRQIVLSKTVDEDGNKIPAGVNSGIAILEVLGNNGTVSGATTAESSAECEKTCNPPLPASLSGPGATPIPSAGSGTPTQSIGFPILGALSSAPAVHFAAADCPPLVTGISPSTGVAGQSVDVLISGQDFTDDAAIDVTGGITTTINSVSPDGTSISATFQIPFDPGAVGAQQVVVSNLFGNSDPVTFTVTTPSAPVIEALDPTSAVAGDLNVPVRIDMTAQGNFQDGDSIVVTGGINSVVDSVSPDGVVVNATFQVPSCGATGTQTVTVSDPFGQSSNPVTFTVTPPPPPTITSISPSSWPAGSNALPVRIFGTGFACPSVRADDPTHVVFGIPSFNPELPGEIDVTVSIDPNTPGETIDVFVDTNDAGFAGAPLQSPVSSRSTLAIKSVSPIKSPGIRPTTKPGTNQAATSKTRAAGHHPTSQNSSAKTAMSPAKNSSILKNSSPVAALVESGPSLVQIVPLAAPPPQIMFLGANIANATAPTTVYVGQQIVLTANINVPAGATISNETWSTPTGALPQGTAIAGYDDGSTPAAGQVAQPSTAGGKVKSLQGTTCGTTSSCAYNTFYWVDQGDGRTITFTYTLQNQQQGTATATFNVKGPALPNAAATTGTTAIAVIPDPPPATTSSTFLKFGDGTANNIGIKFNATAIPPAANGGSFIFVQLISGDTVTVLTGTSSVICTPTSFAQDATPHLDNTYPYAFLTATSTNDNPGLKLTPTWADATRTFTAKMYLMWDPALKADGTGGCQVAKTVQNANNTFSSTPSSCTGSLPVPLGSWAWNFSCDAIDTLSTNLGDAGTVWKRGCGTNTVNPLFQASASFPEWKTNYVNGSGFTCH